MKGLKLASALVAAFVLIAGFAPYCLAEVDQGDSITITIDRRVMPQSVFHVGRFALPEERAEAMVKEVMNEETFFTPLPVASLDRSHPSFALDYLRGPVWMMMNYVVVKALSRYGYNVEAKRIAELTVKGVYKEYVRTGYLWECYHPLGGSVEEISCKGRGARSICRHFAGWTTLVLNFMGEFAQR